MNAIVKFFATGLGLGLAPFAPGTFGTLLGIPFFWALSFQNTPIYMLVTVGFTAFSCVIADRAGHLFGETDSPKIVIDEVAGYLVTMVWLPRTWQAITFGFVLFRILDATKPGPIRYVERNLKGGVGVVMDDIAAGIIANIVLQIVYAKTSWLGVQLL